MPPRETDLRRRYPNAFIGRGDDLAALDRLFADGERLVTLHGPAGIGKTRLASEFCARTALGARVCFVELDEATTAVDAAAAVARALELAQPPPDAETFARVLAGCGDLLLVLDNLEQLVAHAGAFLPAWVALAPRARFLATSREVLRLPAERVHELAPLSLPSLDDDAAGRSEAVELLVDRVRRVRRGYAPAGAEARAVAEIARQLDGIPLAIELAAARMNLLAAQGVLARLADRRFDLLAHGARDATSRQRTLREAIDWSWDLLEPDERAALAQCAVFRGGFTLDAAEAVLDTAREPGARPVLDVLQALREKSLLHVTDAEGHGLRFGLHLSIRHYAAERLAERGGEAGAVSARHARHYADAADAWLAAIDRRGSPEEHARLLLESENLRAVVLCGLARGPLDVATADAVLRTLAALTEVVWAGGSLDAHLALLNDALAAAEAAGAAPGLLARTLTLRGELLRRRGRTREGHDDHLRALELARAAGDQAVEGLALRRLGNTLAGFGRFDEARAAWERALVLLRATGARRDEGITLAWLGSAHLELGAPDEARARYEDALAVHRAVGDTLYEGITLGNLGRQCLERGQLADARAYLESSLAVQRRARNARFEAVALTNLGLLEHVEGRLRAAEACFDEAVAIQRRLGDRLGEGNALGPRGAVWHEQGRLAEAREALAGARALMRDSGNRRYEGLYAAWHAGLEATLDELDAATRLLAEARACLDRAEDPLLPLVRVQEAHVALARARRATVRGDVTGARELRRQAGAALRAVDDAATPARPLLMVVRLAARIAAQALAAAAPTGPSAGAAPADGALVVHHAGHWFRTPDGAVVSCRKHRAVARLLARLADHRNDAPGRPLPAATLLEAGWPGERIEPGAARNRLKVAMATLRKLGLRAWLRTADDGYLLAVEIAVRVEDADEPPAPQRARAM